MLKQGKSSGNCGQGRWVSMRCDFFFFRREIRETGASQYQSALYTTAHTTQVLLHTCSYDMVFLRTVQCRVVQGQCFFFISHHTMFCFIAVHFFFTPHFCLPRSSQVIQNNFFFYFFLTKFDFARWTFGDPIIISNVCIQWWVVLRPEWVLKQ